jgi:hypothetical protein
METETVKLFDKKGIENIISLLDGLEENTQTCQNLLVVTCILSQGLAIEYESFIELVTHSWKLADKVLV